MRIEIRSSAGHTCEHCGAHELVYSPATNRTLETDVLAVFDREAPWYRPLKRAAFRRIRRELIRAAADLRRETARA